MCGIAGVVGSPEHIPVGIPAMASALESRGPDGLGFATWSPHDGLVASTAGPAPVSGGPAVGFAHRRLSIIDLSSDADQPFQSADGACSLIFNGEIYNYVELRRELAAEGVEFRTSSDTEVLLSAYQFWGPSCVERFVGMWALAILDTARRTVFLSRDRFGIKPLYLTRFDGSLAFASEIKALLRLGLVRARPDEVAISRYLLSGAIVDTDRTFFDGIEPFPTAAWAEVDIQDPDRPLETHTYWEVPEEGEPVSLESAAEEFRSAFADSVRLHLRSDVPLGTCLSGGMDSSSIVSIAARSGSAEHSQHPYLAFGFCSSDESVSERRFMDIVAAATGVTLVPITATDDEVSRHLPEIIAYHDEPFGTASIVAQWFVFRRAHQERMKVMLDGQGADEMLGGYHWYLHFLALKMLRQRQVKKFLRFRRDHIRGVGPLEIGRLQVARAILPDAVARVARRNVERISGRVPIVGVGLTSVFRETLRDTPDPQPVASYDDPDLRNLLESQLTRTSLPQLLRYEDRNSMFHSIEARVPFLDHRLVELAFRLGDDKKIAGVETKAVLRRAMRGIVPDAILDRRDKIGFRATPSWTFAYAKKHSADLAANETSYEREWFDSKATAELLTTDRRDSATEFLLWRVLNTKLWARALLD